MSAPNGSEPMRGSDRMTAVSNPLARDLDHVLAHSGDIWEELRGSNLLITGGTGFVGRWLLESLVWAEERYQLGLRAVVLTRDPRRFAASAPDLAARHSISLVPGDMGSFDVGDGDIDFVMHAATETVG